MAGCTFAPAGKTNFVYSTTSYPASRGFFPTWFFLRGLLQVLVNKPTTWMSMTETTLQMLQTMLKGNSAITGYQLI